MGFYSRGWVQKMIDIQEPLKVLLRKIGRREITVKDVATLITLLKEISELPPLTKDKVRNPNTRIIFDIWEDAKEHLLKDFYNSYKHILNAIFNFVVSKIDYDGFYNDFGNWFLGEMIRRGWDFPGQNRPSSQLWHTIKPITRDRLVNTITDKYEILQQRYKTIEEKLGESEEAKAHKISRFDQFIRNVLEAFEREVEAWK